MTKDKYSTYELPSILVKKGIIEVLIVIVTFVLYANTLGHSFTQDDAIAIYDNIYVQDGVSGIGKILTTDSFSGFFRGQDKSSLVAGGRYRPLTMVVFACIHQVVGANPLAYHFFNVLIYALLCVIFYRLLMSIDMNWERKKFQYFVLMTTMIFAVHPIHTEVVANVKGLDEIFSLLFSLLAMKSAISYVHSKNIGRLLIMILCFLSAILSKENAAAFVIIIPLVLLFYTKSSSNKKGILIPSYLLIVSFIAYWILRTRIVGADLGSPLGEMMNNPFIKIEDGRYLPFTSGERWASIIYGMGKYIQLLVFPHPLTHDYYPRHFGVANFAQLSVWMAIIMNVTLGLIALLGLRKRSFISFCIIFFYVTIALMSNVVFPIGTHLSERFLFTPSVAISLIIAYGLVQLRDVRKYQGVVPFLFIGIIAIGSLKTILRNTAWKDDLTLFTTDVKVSTNSAKVQNAAGGALLAAALEEPDEVQKNAMITQAVVHLQKAIKIHPNYKEAYLLLGNGYSYLREYDQSILSYNNALRVNPYYTEAERNLLIVLREGARKAGSVERDFPKAIRYLQKALTIQPDDFESTALLGTAYGSSGEHFKAIGHYEKAIELNPDIAMTYVNLGFAQLNAGMEDDAQINFNKALRIDPKAMDQFQK